MRPIASRKVDILDKRSCALREAINGSTIISFEDTIPKGEIVTFHEHETIKLDMPHGDRIGSRRRRILKNPHRHRKRCRRHLTKNATVARFGGKSVRSLGIILLTTRAYDLELKTEFTVVDHPMPFDAIIGRPWLHQMRAVASVYHQCVKFLSPTGEKNHTQKPKTGPSLLHVRIPKDATEGGEYPTRTRPLTSRMTCLPS